MTLLVTASTPEKAAPLVAALVACGAPAERVRALLPADRGEARRLAAGASGLVLGGGPDLDPSYYGEEPIPGAHLAILPERDELDWEALAGAREARVPVWGVCRGMQVINVALGGTLWQDLPSQLAGSLLHDLDHPNDALIHGVEVTDAETRTGAILARELALVNSRHHQGVRRLAAGLVTVGRSPDALIEAVELSDSGWWLRAVQWHPENLVAMDQQRALWNEFLAAAEAFSSGRRPAGQSAERKEGDGNGGRSRADRSAGRERAGRDGGRISATPESGPGPAAAAGDPP
jgi:putative glutamine amidotransferase